MSDPKNILPQLRRELADKLKNYPTTLEHFAFQYGASTFNKSRFACHVNFISTCLRSNIIPFGFRSNWKPSIANVHPDTVSKHIQDCSRRLMRSSLRSFQRSRNTNSDRMERFLNLIKESCNYTDFNHIRHTVHVLNRKYYECLTAIKQSKLDRLLSEQKPNNATISLPDTSKLVVTIPSDLDLTDDERSVLSKGLSFVPKREFVDDFQVKSDLELFYRRLRLKARFHNHNILPKEQDDFTCLVKNKSNWTPPAGQFKTLDLYIEKCRHDVNQINFKRRTKCNNLSHQEIKALRSLRNNNNLVIKHADKGGATVVWKRELYIAEGERQLSDNATYLPLLQDPTAQDQSLVSTAIDDMINNNELPPTAKCLVNPHPSC
ncbi:uncharacterized protein LOC117100195 [Anneissia japonica]|uniref:uncharacterized protein LOC117100195 n=1 Tax=Anneissia japonica TaxID=1529436 RepID=UPI0014259E17|nr:uncharacterized protein LOC117100195 [Anneissia japonica]